MTPRDNSRARRPAEHCRPRAASLALDRAVFCLDTHPSAERTLPLSESAGMHQIWCLLFRERQRLAAYFSLTNHSPSIAQDHISNRHIPRLETYLTPVKSARGPVLIATKRDMHLALLSLAFLPSRDGGEPSRCRRQSPLDDILADFAARFSNAESAGERPEHRGVNDAR
jgi:hypothetical protein